MDNNMKYTAIYCRVASGAFEDRFTIDIQEKAMIDFAKERGYSNLVSYRDNACSGLSLDRPAFSKLDADITAGKVAAVIVRDISRIGRNFNDVGTWLDGLEEKGVVLVSADGYQHDLIFFTNFQKVLAEYANSQNIARALKKKHGTTAASSSARVSL